MLVVPNKKTVNKIPAQLESSELLNKYYVNFPVFYKCIVEETESEDRLSRFAP